MIPILKQRYVAKTLLVIFSFTIVVFVLTTQSSLWDRDEPRFARIACEMLQSGEWLLPTMNGQVFAKKPPFAFWMMAGSMALFGVNPVAARLPAVFSLAATGWVVFLLGRKLFSPHVGFWSSAILMSSAMTMYMGSAAMVDVPLLAFITLAMWSHLKGIFHPKHWYLYWPILALALGLSELTKHPVGMATVVPATCFSTWMLRKRMQIPKTYWLGLVAAFAAGYALHQSWFLSVRNMAPGFVEEMLMRQIVGRIIAPMEGYGANHLWGYLALLPIYFPILMLGFAPWSVFLPAGISALIRRRVGERTSQVFLISWALPIFVLFSLAATKLPHYVLPLFPPAALLTAAALESWRNGNLDPRDRRWLVGGAWVMTSVSFALGILLCLGDFFMGQGLWRMEIVIPGVAIPVFSLIVLRLIRKENIYSAARLLMVGMPLLVLLSARLILPAIEPLIKISPVLAETIRTHRLKDDAVAMCGYGEPSFIFYMNLPDDQPITILKQDPTTLHAWLSAPGAGWLVVYDSLWKEMINRHDRLKGPEPGLWCRYSTPMTGQGVTRCGWSNACRKKTHFFSRRSAVEKF